jgi:hypothetical protein
MSHGLFLTHRFNPILSASANGSWEMGRERDEPRSGILYYASLAATPLKTLTDSLVYSGHKQWTGRTTTTRNSVVLLNTAQLYRGIDATLNLGAAFASDEQDEGAPLRRREYHVNVGTGITPHPNLALTGYYLGKLSHASGGAGGGSQDTTENRLDLGLSFTPFRTLFLSAAASIAAETGKATTATQNYGLSWAPFPDGSLQFAFFYAENRLPENGKSRIIQPTLRWYLSPRRRSYVEASYQLNTSKAGTLETESRLFSTRLNLYY